MRCAYFDAGVCRSCELMGVPYAEQLAAKVAEARTLLAAHPEAVWRDPAPSPEDGFRNKAKMVVGGTVGAPTLGILDDDRRGVDLRGCGVLAPGLRDAMPAIASFITRASLEPYDIPARRGELKNVLLTESPDGELMLRLVLRSTEALARIRKHSASLLAEVPQIAVLTVNLQPEHKAVLEGETEIVLSQAETLPMRTGDVVLHLRPGGFFQTNTAIAAGLYAQAAEWLETLAPRTVWDLYCGVGGFALHLAAPGREVVGIETSAAAVESARLTAAEAGIAGVTFQVGDAKAYAVRREAPDAVVVNPPRRGLGAEFAAQLERTGPATIVYSSCNPVTLARDLRGMPSYEVVEARLFDMFPQTRHAEVMTLLRRREGAMRTLRIDGAAVHDIPSFYDEVNRVFMVGVDWVLGPSLDAFNDLLHGGYGALDTDEPVRVVLGDDRRLREALGLETTRQYYLAKLAEPERFNVAVFEERLRELEAGEGPTYYEIVREIFADHPEIDVVED